MTFKMRSGTFFAALFAFTLAAPMDHRLEDIKCRCLSFSTDAKPTLCTYMESHAFDFYTASSIASNYDLKVQFASESTIDKVLSINRPLPNEVLQSISEGQVANVEPSNLLQRENKIVCGFGDEAKHLGSHDSTFDPECHFIGYIVGGMTLFTLIYVLLVSAWTRCFAPEGAIKLDGDEKVLMADSEASSTTTSQEQFEDSAPTNT